MNTENIDAISRKGERYSIKTITNNGSTGVFYGLPPIDSNEMLRQKFEYVIIVKLNDNFELENIIEKTAIGASILLPIYYSNYKIYR